MPRPTSSIVYILAAAVAFSGAGACSTYRESSGESARPGYRESRAEQAVAAFRAADPTISRFFDNSYGYAIFPVVTKGGAGIGAAHGKDAVVYEQGRVVGFAELTQVTLGAQLGGQDFREIVFFQDKAALDLFKRNELQFSANASAVAASSGSAASADYASGVAVFTLPIGGLMFEASIGGQKFAFTSKE